MPAGFRELPFQFQQRGPELSRAEGEKLARFIEQRDQDLENFLGGIGGGGGSPFAYTIGTIEAGLSEGDVDALISLSDDVGPVIQAAIDAGFVFIFFALGSYSWMTPVTMPSTGALALVGLPQAGLIYMGTGAALSGGHTVSLFGVQLFSLDEVWSPESGTPAASVDLHDRAVAFGEINHDSGLVIKSFNASFQLTCTSDTFTLIARGNAGNAQNQIVSSCTGAIGVVLQDMEAVVELSTTSTASLSVSNSTIYGINPTITALSGIVGVHSSSVGVSGQDTLFDVASLVLTADSGTFTMDNNLNNGASTIQAMDGRFIRTDSSATVPLVAVSGTSEFVSCLFREHDSMTSQTVLHVDNGADDTWLSACLFRNGSTTPTDVLIDADNVVVRKCTGNDTGAVPFITDNGTGTVVD